MGDGLYRELRERLQSEKRELEKTLDSLNSGLQERLTDSIGELSSYDQHTADLGQETFERAKDLALRDNTKRLLEDAEAALELMEKGEYGICQECGQPIDERRLRAVPAASLCYACKTAQEAKRRDDWNRPVEERVIPFDLTWEDNVGFDAEDAWQAVARWGTANSPQDIPGAYDYDDTYINADEDIGTVTPLEGIESDGALTTDWDGIYPRPREKTDGDFLEEP
ncbi:MAG: conjugal transfer protein TraR [Firmicutes bacterium]|nr:conjugal transfer protein TraR [Bacillota bacterium]